MTINNENSHVLCLSGMLYDENRKLIKRNNVIEWKVGSSSVIVNYEELKTNYYPTFAIEIENNKNVFKLTDDIDKSKGIGHPSLPDPEELEPMDSCDTGKLDFDEFDQKEESSQEESSLEITSQGVENGSKKSLKNTDIKECPLKKSCGEYTSISSNRCSLDSETDVIKNCSNCISEVTNTESYETSGSLSQLSSSSLFAYPPSSLNSDISREPFIDVQGDDNTNIHTDNKCIEHEYRSTDDIERDIDSENLKIYPEYPEESETEDEEFEHSSLNNKGLTETTPNKVTQTYAASKHDGVKNFVAISSHKGNLHNHNFPWQINFVSLKCDINFKCFIESSVHLQQTFVLHGTETRKKNTEILLGKEQYRTASCMKHIMIGGCLTVFCKNESLEDIEFKAKETTGTKLYMRNGHLHFHGAIFNLNEKGEICPELLHHDIETMLSAHFVTKRNGKIFLNQSNWLTDVPFDLKNEVDRRGTVERYLNKKLSKSESCHILDEREEGEMYMYEKKLHHKGISVSSNCITDERLDQVDRSQLLHVLWPLLMSKVMSVQLIGSMHDLSSLDQFSSAKIFKSDIRHMCDSIQLEYGMRSDYPHVQRGSMSASKKDEVAPFVSGMEPASGVRMRVLKFLTLMRNRICQDPLTAVRLTAVNFSDDIERIPKLYESTGIHDVIDKKNSTSIPAAHNGKHAIIKFLLKHNSDINCNNAIPLLIDHQSIDINQHDTTNLCPTNMLHTGKDKFFTLLSVLSGNEQLSNWTVAELHPKIQLNLCDNQLSSLTFTSHNSHFIFTHHFINIYGESDINFINKFLFHLSVPNIGTRNRIAKSVQVDAEKHCKKRNDETDGIASVQVEVEEVCKERNIETNIESDINFLNKFLFHLSVPNIGTRNLIAKSFQVDDQKSCKNRNDKTDAKFASVQVDVEEVCKKRNIETDVVNLTVPFCADQMFGCSLTFEPVSTTKHFNESPEALHKRLTDNKVKSNCTQQAKSEALHKRLTNNKVKSNCSPQVKSGSWGNNSNKPVHKEDKKYLKKLLWKFYKKTCKKKCHVGKLKAVTRTRRKHPPNFEYLVKSFFAELENDPSLKKFDEFEIKLIFKTFYQKFGYLEYPVYPVYGKQGQLADSPRDHGEQTENETREEVRFTTPSETTGGSEESVNEGIGVYFDEMTHGPQPTLSETMRFQLMRLKSFWSFPRNIDVSPIILAKWGFYYTGSCAETRCFCCGVSYRDWDDGDNVEEVHRRISPNCPFLTGIDVRNVPVYRSDDQSRRQLEAPVDTGSTEQGTAQNVINTGRSSAQSGHCDRSNFAYLARETVATTEPSATSIITGERQSTSNTGNSETTSVSVTTNAAASITSGATASSGTSTSPSSTLTANSNITSTATTAASSTAVGTSDASVTAISTATTTSSTSATSLPRPATASTPTNVVSGQGGNTVATTTGNLVSSAGQGRSSSSTSRANTSSSQSSASAATHQRYDPLGINFDKPRYPSYAVVSNRSASFSSWPEYLRTPREMAVAGFFYAGYGDYVRCFFCGGGLRNWDAQDDPWREHAKWFPRCAFVRMNKGEKFVINILKEQEEMERQKAQGSAMAFQVDEATLGATAGPPQSETESSAVRAVKEMGIKEDVIKKALDIFQRRQSPGEKSVELDATILMHIILDEMDSSPTTEEPPSASGGSPLPSAGGSPITVAATSESTISAGEDTAETESMQGATARNEEKGKSKSSGKGKSKNGKKKQKEKPKEVQPAEVTGEKDEDIAFLQNENRELREQLICKICCEKSVSVAFLPCGHLVCCDDCAPAMRKCPICRDHIRGTVKTFFP